MVNFANYARSEVSLDPKPYIFGQLEGDVTLMVRPATKANREWFNANLRGPGAAVAMGRRELSAAVIEEARRRNIQLFSKHIVTGWTGVRDASGADVPFSQEHCEQFLAQIPADMFDDLVGFCSEPDNFRQSAGFARTEAEGKN